jgi:hypothetical protein
MEDTITEDMIDDIIEDIIQHLYDNKINIKDKKINLLCYIDNYLTENDIDIGNIYLDDLVDIVITIMNKRCNNNKNTNDDDIIFKLDEEEIEQTELKTVIKKFDSLYKKAKKIDIDITTSPIGSYKESLSSSWDNILNRIDSIYKKIE